MKKSRPKPAPTQLETYQKYCIYWQSLFGMTDWTFTFESKPLGNLVAEVSYNTTSRLATLRISSRMKRTQDEIKFDALHEVMHVLLADLTSYGEAMFQGDVVIREEHRIIARIEHLMKGEFINVSK